MTSAAKNNTLDQTDGTVITTANISVTSATGDVLSAGSVTGTAPTVTALTAAAYTGRGYRTIVNSSADAQSLFWSQTASLTFLTKLKFRVNAAGAGASGSQLPTGAAHTFMLPRNSANTKLFKPQLTQAGVCQVQNGAGTATALSFNGGTALSDGYYYIELAGTIATSTTGQLAGRLFALATGAQVGTTQSTSTLDMGTTGITTLGFSKPEPGGVLVNGFDWDDPGFDVGTTTFTGPAATLAASLAVSAPGVAGSTVITVPANAVVTATASGATGGSGTTYMYSFDFGDVPGGSPTTPSSTPSATHTYVNGGDYTVSLYLDKV